MKIQLCASLLAVALAPFLSEIANAKLNQPLLILEGQDRRSGRACTLSVLDIVGNPGEAGSSIKAVTSYTHNTESAGEFTLNQFGEGNLIGTGADQRNQLTLFFEGGVFDFARITRFTLRWWHVHHAHNYSCINLKVRN